MFPVPNFIEIERKCIKLEQYFIYALAQNKAFTLSIFTKLSITRQSQVKTLCAGFRLNH